MQALKLLHLVKGSTEFFVAHRIIRAVHAGSSVITLLQGHGGIGDLTAIVHDSPESIVNVGEKLCSAAGLNVLHPVAARPGATLVKIPDHTESMAVRMRRRLRLTFRPRQSNR